MTITKARRWARRNWWKLGLLTMAGWTGLYIAVLVPWQYQRRFAEQRASGLASVGWEPASLWRQPSWRPMLQKGTPLLAAHVSIAPLGSTFFDTEENNRDRRILRNVSIELEVKSPADSAEKIRLLAERAGGYLVASQVGGGPDVPDSDITVRLPSSRLEQTLKEIKSLAVRVESEKNEASDVTKDYVDKDAQLRNLRAAETQYLGIMKRAATVKDTLDVSEKLAEVRGQIEQQQAEFTALAKRVETVAVAVSLRAEADTQVFGLHWRPLYELKLAARDGLESLGSYAASMTAAVFHLPAFLLWVATITLVAAVGWRFTRWAWRKVFLAAKPMTPS
jgi:Domain of unknown function (DUF4349)